MRILIAALGLVVALPGIARAVTCVNDYCVINNGLAPPNPTNVIDDGTYLLGAVSVRNVGCPPGWPAGSYHDPCPSPGQPTHVEVADGGEAGGFFLSAYDSSTITMSGGIVGVLNACNSSTVTMNGGTVGGWLDGDPSSTITMSGGMVNYINAYGILTMNGGTVVDFLRASGSGSATIISGTVGGDLRTYGSPTVTMSGGWFGGDLLAYGGAITIVGSDFEVNGTPVPYGDLTALIGNLTGTLASGEHIDNRFYQGGGSYTGTIRLVPEPTTALLVGVSIFIMAHARVYRFSRSHRA